MWIAPCSGGSQTTQRRWTDMIASHIVYAVSCPTLASVLRCCLTLSNSVLSNCSICFKTASEMTYTVSTPTNQPTKSVACHMHLVITRLSNSSYNHVCGVRIICVPIKSYIFVERAMCLSSLLKTWVLSVMDVFLLYVCYINKTGFSLSSLWKPPL